MITFTWLVTGCSSGFGEELVQNILDRGDNIIATCQGSKDRIKYLKDAGAITLSLDLTASRFWKVGKGSS
ncbi:putative short-chain oxidoreductase protein [Botrytis fragariae]|uniref:Putative short-chain oxidoreductase protein n=1 Tax=Botrytis fragariae TaxID=1964551 RepID=A0A8H6B4Z9_9HELO|nr:putative short-chain oxidoreductase protein [Botrytis fragariae]KAF5879536.1 putative short-chain oxidoreductase protein [Botrytis fragariae]